MFRTRAFRRHQQERATQKTWRLLRAWGWLHPSQVGSFRRKTEEEHQAWARRWVQLMTSTHRKPCSCTGCGNPRRHFGTKTRKEIIAQMGFKEWRTWQDSNPRLSDPYPECQGL